MSLTQDIFSHFMMLHEAMRILASSLYMSSMINYAEDLLKSYVKQLSDLYGEEHISYNVHSLIHLVDDCHVYGVLDNLVLLLLKTAFNHSDVNLKKKFYSYSTT